MLLKVVMASGKKYNIYKESSVSFCKFRSCVTDVSHD